ncbi:hypothetical protein RHMOL_Rhmol11G0202900 [Rhododendron molle]|uniref:Uncharacterized protein n=1 Tax=Rhododendron molle TaxID=49168 RepID=A0ACC0LVE1_RHOML|nr:hypothetical protein RHMOL_Rhmol11G0202900 [Rhododendron molle]
MTYPLPSGWSLLPVVPPANEKRGVTSKLILRFLATDESNAHPTYKRKLLELEETEYTYVFGRARWPGAPHHVLKTPFFAQLTTLPSDENETNQPIIGHSTIHDMVKTSTLVPHHVENVRLEKDICRLAGTVPNATATGDIESMAMYAGQGVGLIKEILPVREVVERLVAEAQFLISHILSFENC